MTGISSGIGLVSGIDTAALINQLLAVEARPKLLAQSRQASLQSQQSAFLGINSLLATLQTAAAKFATDKTFDAKQASSSDDAVLKATANASALPGEYQFIVDQLVTSNQYLSRGFSDSNATALGLTEFSIEHGNGRLSTESLLSDLNGGNGVARGKIRITDSSGSSDVIDLSKAVTVSDVLEAINASEDIQVTAKVSVDGSGFTIVDTAGGASPLTIANDAGYTTATSLGIEGTDGDLDGEIIGSQVNTISLATSLESLNDGNGVRINRGLDFVDFTINTADGGTHDIRLGKITISEDEIEEPVATLQGLKDRIESQSSGAVTVSISADGQGITLTDTTTGGSTFEVVAGTADATEAAIDLGIFKSADVGTPTAITGDRVRAGLNSVLTRSLNGGNGLNGATTLTIQDRSGGSDSFTLDPNTSLSDIIEQINASSAIDVTVSLNRVGNGLKITDTSGGGGNLIVDGDAAAELGIGTGAGGIASNEVNGTNVQLQYISAATKLSDLNYGRGVGAGSFRITDGMGITAEVTIGKSDTTLADVIAEINSKDLSIIARLNDSGDGLIIENTAETPVAAIQVESVTGSTAKDLRILGTAADVETANYIDGSYEQRIEVEATDTLADLISKINDSGGTVTASLVNSGSGNTPFFMNLTSKITGTAGDMIIDTGAIDLGLNEMVDAQDAVVFFGSQDPANAILITSTTNTLDGVVAGVSIDLKGKSDSPVTLTVTDDSEKKVTAVKDFVKAFNAVLTRLNDVTKFDPESERRGPLQGNSTVARMRSQLYRTIQGRPMGVDSQYQYFAQVGLNIKSGGKLELDEEKLREALTTDPDAVKELFAAKKLAEDQDIPIGEGEVTYESPEPIYESLGIAERINVLVKDLTNSVDGTLTLVNRNFDSLIQLQAKRIERFDERLEARRVVLERQFAAMERSLSALQGQQSALLSISGSLG